MIINEYLIQYNSNLCHLLSTLPNTQYIVQLKKTQQTDHISYGELHYYWIFKVYEMQQAEFQLYWNNDKKYVCHIYYIYVTPYYNFDYNEFYLTKSGKFHADLAVTAKVSE